MSLRQPGGRQMFWLWTGVLLAPAAWAVALSSLFWLTHPVCQGAGRGFMWATAVVCFLVALVTGVGATLGLVREGLPSEGAGLTPFMLRLGIGIAAIFSLVLLLTMVPIAVLTPCPL